MQQATMIQANGNVQNCDDDLPTARLISPSEADDGRTDHSMSQYGVIVRDAIPVPGENVTSYTPERERALAHLAAHRGRLQAEQELEEIQRASRNIGAIQYYSKAEVEAANRLARERMRAEEMGRTQTNERAPAVKEWENNSSAKRKVECRQGTFGKDYEVSEYASVYEYDVKDYQTSSYKSVYER